MITLKQINYTIEEYANENEYYNTSYSQTTYNYMILEYNYKSHQNKLKQQMKQIEEKKQIEKRLKQLDIDAKLLHKLLNKNI